MIADRSKTQARRRRGGFGLIEMAVAGVLIAAAMTATVLLVGRVALERLAVERRERALLEAQNLLERAVARPWDDLRAGPAGAPGLGGGAAGLPPGSMASLAVAAADDAPARKRVTVEIRWHDRSGRPEAPVRLVAWVYRRGESPR